LHQDLLKELSKVPCHVALHDNWAEYYYMCMLTCTTVIVVFDGQWRDSKYAEGEWYLFARNATQKFVDAKRNSNNTFNFQLLVIYDHSFTLQHVKSALGEMGFPPELQETAKMIRANILQYLPEDPYNPLSWKAIPLDPELLRPVIEMVLESEARFRPADKVFSTPEERELAYKHIFERDWRNLAKTHAAEAWEGGWWKPKSGNDAIFALAATVAVLAVAAFVWHRQTKSR